MVPVWSLTRDHPSEQASKHASTSSVGSDKQSGHSLIGSVRVCTMEKQIVMRHEEGNWDAVACMGGRKDGWGWLGGKDRGRGPQDEIGGAAPKTGEEWTDLFFSRDCRNWCR